MQKMSRVVSYPILGAGIMYALGSAVMTLEEDDITRRWSSPFPAIRGSEGSSIWAWPRGPNSL